LGENFDPNKLLKAFSKLQLKPGYTLGFRIRKVFLGGLGKVFLKKDNEEIEFYEDPDIFETKKETETQIDSFIFEESDLGYFQLAWFMEEVKLLSLFWHAVYISTSLVYSFEDFKTFAKGDFFPQAKRDISFWETLKEIDLRPTISYAKNEVIVNMYRFSSWVIFPRFNGH